MIKRWSRRPRAKGLFLFFLFPWIVQIWVSHLTFLCLVFLPLKGWDGSPDPLLLRGRVALQLCSVGLRWEHRAQSCSGSGGGSRWYGPGSLPGWCRGARSKSRKCWLSKFTWFLEALIFPRLLFKGFCIFQCKMWKLNWDLRNCIEWSHADGVTAPLPSCVGLSSAENVMIVWLVLSPVITNEKRWTSCFQAA